MSYEVLDYLKTFARFPFSLRRYLKHRLTLEEAKRIVAERMELREENFLRVVERSIYGYPHSPYLPLLRMAGCEMGDLRAHVKQKGVEGALRDLRQEGVYVTFEEFKGRRPIVRRSQTIPVQARDFDNPRMRRDFSVQTGGSSGAAANVGVDLEYLAERAVDEMIALDATGLLDLPALRWSRILPTGTLRSILRDLYFEVLPLHWFSPAGLRDSKYWLRYGLATFYILSWLRLSGVRVPLPEHVGVDQANLIVKAVYEILQEHGRCVLHTTVSNGLRVCLAAEESGIALNGTTIVSSSEAATPAKVDRMVRSGVRFVSNYGMVETSRLASGCPESLDAGDVHLHKDAFALIPFPFDIPNFGISVPAFNLTTLLLAAPKVMLNVQMDDYGVVEDRHCGCAFESYGLTTHLREIRSYGKLTGEGVTLVDNEILRILEEVLPAQFGGSPLDYQLTEKEDQEGFTRLYLDISPRVGIVDENQVTDVMLRAMRQSSPMADAARTTWEQTQAIQVRRREPTQTERGKLLPLHIANRARKLIE